MKRLKKAGWSFLFLARMLIIATACMLVGNFIAFGLLQCPNWQRIYKDIGVKKGETYQTEFIDEGFEVRQEWGFTGEDIRTAWQSGVRELSIDGELYFFEVRFNVRDYNDFDPETEVGQIWYICKIYVGYVESGKSSWAGKYSTVDYFSMCMEKDEAGDWQLVNYGFA